MARGKATAELDAGALARKYRGKGQSDEQVYRTLRSLGVPAREARAAVVNLGPTSSTKRAGTGPATSPAAPSGKAPAAPPASPSGSGFSMPSFKAPDVSSVTLTPPRRLSGGDLGGFLFGIGLYALMLNYLQNGPEGVKGWLSAKFLNQPVDLPGAEPKPRRRSSSSGLTSTRPARPVRV